MLKCVSCILEVEEERRVLNIFCLIFDTSCFTLVTHYYHSRSITGNGSTPISVDRYRNVGLPGNLHMVPRKRK